MSFICFVDGGGRRIKIGDEALTTMTAFIQRRSGDLEAGGVLLGREIIGVGDLVVDEATPPLAGDRRSRLAFHRAAAAHQERVTEAWRASDGAYGYLGEWHTHPEAHPQPSEIDYGDWMRRLVEDEVPLDIVIYVILGTEELGAWTGHRRSRTLRPLGRHVLSEGFNRR